MKHFFNELKIFFEGRKSYLVAILMMAVGYYLKDNSLLLEGLALITLRAGISKINK